MGFFKKLFSGEEKETKLEKEIKQNVEKGANYSHVTRENKIMCNGCSEEIEGKPRIKKHGGKMLFFHKRCWKRMCKGQLPIVK